jgi:phosphoglycerol transferase MdoB-like AlkP superfamily enzyme
MHLVLAGATVALILSFIGLGAVAFNRWFRRYSIFTILMLIIFGGLTAQQAPLVAAQQPTPWLGIMERVNVYGAMLWVLVLAVILLRAGKRSKDS